VGFFSDLKVFSTLRNSALNIHESFTSSRIAIPSDAQINYGIECRDGMHSRAHVRSKIGGSTTETAPLTKRRQAQ
jgi:hypothetical protein